MKSRYIKTTKKAARSRCPQFCSACSHCNGFYTEEIKASAGNTKQLYAREAEDYFYHFTASFERNNSLRVIL